MYLYEKQAYFICLHLLDVFSSFHFAQQKKQNETCVKENRYPNQTEATNKFPNY